jgi:hypothetical protein
LERRLKLFLLSRILRRFSMTDTTEPAYVETLNDLISKAAADWTTTDRHALVAALREQRERWNVEQRTGSNKRVTAKKTEVVRKGARSLSLEGLKL